MDKKIQIYLDVLRGTEGTSFSKISAAFLKYAAPRGRDSFFQFFYNQSRTFSAKIIHLLDISAPHGLDYFRIELNKVFDSALVKSRIKWGCDFHALLRSVSQYFPALTSTVMGDGELLSSLASVKKEEGVGEFKSEEVSFEVSSLNEKDRALFEDLYQQISVILMSRDFHFPDVISIFSESGLATGFSEQNLGQHKDPRTGDSFMHLLIINREEKCFDDVKKTIRYLQSMGVAVDARNKQGETPLYRASILELPEMAAFLYFELKAQFDPDDGSAEKPLFLPTEFMAFDDASKTATPIDFVRTVSSSRFILGADSGVKISAPFAEGHVGSLKAVVSGFDRASSLSSAS